MCESHEKEPSLFASSNEETEKLNSVTQATFLGIFSRKCVDQSVPSSGRRKKILNQNELFFEKG